MDDGLHIKLLDEVNPKGPNDIAFLIENAKGLGYYPIDFKEVLSINTR